MKKKPDLPTNVEKLRHKLESLRLIASDAPDRSQLASFSDGLATALDELQKQADELILAKELAESESRKYYELFEGAPDGYIVTDTKGRIMEATEQLARCCLCHQRISSENHFRFSLNEITVSNQLISSNSY